MCPFTKEECKSDCALYIHNIRSDFNSPCSLKLNAMFAIFQNEKLLDSMIEKKF